MTQLVESASVLLDHTYYYTGPQVEPDAIIDIDNRFTLQARYWIKVDDVAENLNDWNRYIDNAHHIPDEQEGLWTLNPFYRSARIIAPNGRQTGIWYSRHDHTVVQFPDPSTTLCANNSGWERKTVSSSFLDCEAFRHLSRPCVKVAQFGCTENKRTCHFDKGFKDLAGDFLTPR